MWAGPAEATLDRALFSNDNCPIMDETTIQHSTVDMGVNQHIAPTYCIDPIKYHVKYFG
jgi:hypothetical protein